MISQELQSIFLAALKEAFERRHEFLCLEHFLYVFASTPFGERLLGLCQVNVPLLKKELEQFFDEKLETVPADREYEPEQTLAFKRVLERAISHVESSGKKELDSASILSSLFLEKDSYAVYLLEKQGIQRFHVVYALSHQIPSSNKKSDTTYTQHFSSSPTIEQTESSMFFERVPFCVDLVAKAKAGQIDPLVGRDNELDRVFQILCRRRKNNPLFVGDAGVGKTSIVEGLALRIALGKVPAQLKNVSIFSLDIGGLLAGTKFRGEFEQRIKTVLESLQKIPGAILFADEIHSLFGAGSTTGSPDATNLLKPMLSSGELRLIGATSHVEFKSTFDKDPAFLRRFQRIDILEPSIEEATAIILGLKKHYEKHHGVKYTKAALQAAVQLSCRYLPEKKLPDKAIDLIDEAGAYIQVHEPSGKRIVDVLLIENVLSNITKIPIRAKETDKSRLFSLKETLKKQIFGQDAAVDQIVTSIHLAQAGLSITNRPIGSFLFSGPTGVGKTELARQIASALGIDFIRFDMSEYMEQHSVARLIGTPPGYVGFDQGGLLTDAVRKQPYAVLLLDEIEKAHPDVLNILLQVMDYATLTDHNGRKVDFRNIILIMTSNAGAQESLSGKLGSIGFGEKTQSQPEKTAVERVFSPEFRNRLDGWISFSVLLEESIEKIVRKLIQEFAVLLQSNHIELVIGDEVIKYFAHHGYDKLYGARPMQRMLQTKLRKPIAEEILFGRLTNGGKVEVTLTGVQEKQELLFSYSKTKRNKKRPVVDRENL